MQFLERLYNTFREASNNFDFSKELNGDKLFKMKERLENEIKASTATTSTGKARIKSCLSYAKEVREKRPILGYTDNSQLKEGNENLQVFTDSFFLVALSPDDKLPIEDYTEVESLKGARYPRVDRIASKNFIDKNMYIDIKINDILNAFKINKSLRLYEFSGNKDFAYKINEFYFKKLITFLNVKSDETVRLYATLNDPYHNKPLYIVRDSGSFGLVLPMRED